MAYTKEYYLNRVKKVNEIYVYWHSKGVYNEYIYKHYIRNQFDISRATFYNYLTIPYSSMIKKLCEEKEKKRQLDEELDRINLKLF
ncbi:hypothetical protein N9251_00605 [Gammaproteobacteria bacterium]|nr:hypothetical protein [Gammaproteobacteria bacterium]